MPRPLKWSILGAHTIILSKNNHKVTKTDYVWFEFLWIRRYYNFCCISLKDSFWLAKKMWKRNVETAALDLMNSFNCSKCQNLGLTWANLLVFPTFRYKIFLVHLIHGVLQILHKEWKMSQSQTEVILVFFRYLIC